MPDVPACLQVFADHARLSVHVVPGAPRTQVVGLHGTALKIKLAAPPVDGKANAELVAWIAQSLSLPRAEVELWQGASSRQKVLRLHTGDTQRVVERVRAWVDAQAA